MANTRDPTKSSISYIVNITMNTDANNHNGASTTLVAPFTNMV